jgi:ABC-2 type transport system permease protein
VLVLSVGLFVSTVSDTQQQVAFVGFFLMMVFVMLSGLFTPTESMPIWAQYLDRINPLYYFVRIMRGVILKGAHFLDITSDLFSMTVFAGIMFTLAVQKYRKTT